MDRAAGNQRENSNPASAEGTAATALQDLSNDRPHLGAPLALLQVCLGGTCFFQAWEVPHCLWLCYMVPRKREPSAVPSCVAAGLMGSADCVQHMEATRTGGSQQPPQDSKTHPHI